MDYIKNIRKVLGKIMVGALPLLSKQAFLVVPDCLLARDSGWTEKVNEWVCERPESEDKENVGHGAKWTDPRAH